MNIIKLLSSLSRKHSLAAAFCESEFDVHCFSNACFVDACLLRVALAESEIEIKSDAYKSGSIYDGSSQAIFAYI
jgi:hypothetical protein